MSELPRMLEANRSYAESFAQGDLEIGPALILTCIDTRLDPAKSSASGSVTRT